MQDSDKIISYHEMVAIEKMTLQRGMVFSDGKRKYSILLMSQRKDAVYNDGFDENGNLIYKAAMDFKSVIRKIPELVKVYEKIDSGVWSTKGFFQLIDVKQISDGERNVFKFYLKPVLTKIFNRVEEIPFNRLIPTLVKVKVWERDRGKCVLCGAMENLHYDHELPYAKGGTSLTDKNIRILCAMCNLRKSDKIMVFVC